MNLFCSDQNNYLFKIIIIIFFLFLITFGKKETNKIVEGVYKISSSLRKYHLNYQNNKLLISNLNEYFKFININLNNYFIELWTINKILGVNENGEIFFYNKNENINNTNKISWKIIQINKNNYLIQNIYNNKYLKVNNKKDLYLSDVSKFYLNIIGSKLKFHIIKLFEENKIENEYIKLVEDEPIDIVTKYIDLTDKDLKMKGIKFIPKDKDNEELRYSIRSILKYIPWIRYIYILMPNEKVKYFKEPSEISEKIKYIKDKDLIGFDSANICSFTFELFKMEKFGLSKNFIYMEDDYFIGKPLKKTDFFYYDKKSKKILPYLLNSKFDEINKLKVLSEYNDLFNKRKIIDPHSYFGWLSQILSVERFFIENYKFPLIKAEFTHNAISENIDDLKEIYEVIQKYKYINETLYSKQRQNLALNFQHFYNLYLLNIKNRKVHPIPYKYFSVEGLNISDMDVELFVINTGGDHNPSIQQFQEELKIMKERFPYKTKYEIDSSIK